MQVAIYLTLKFNYVLLCMFILYIRLTDDTVMFKLSLPHTVAVSSMVGDILTVKFSKNTLSGVYKSKEQTVVASGDTVL